MAEIKKGEMFSLGQRREKKQDEERKEFSNLDNAFTIKYIIDNYFTGEKGTEKLLRVLEKNVPDEQNREDILEFINDLTTDNGDEEVDEADAMEEEFGLVNMLSLAAGKNKEQIEEELAGVMHEVAKQLKKQDEGPRKPASVHKFSK